MDLAVISNFNSFAAHVSVHRNDLLFIGLATTQILKTGSLFKVLTIFTNSNFGQINTIFFSISNYEENSNNDQQFKYVFSRGFHWSLLILNKFHGKLYNFDIIKGLNHKYAKKKN